MRLADFTANLQFATFVAVSFEASMYLTNASLNRRESSNFALSSSDESNLISMDGSGTPTHEHIICKFGQYAWYSSRKPRRSVYLRSKISWEAWFSRREASMVSGSFPVVLSEKNFDFCKGHSRGHLLLVEAPLPQFAGYCPPTF